MIPLPAFIDPDAWAEFIESRKFKKKPLTTGAATRVLKRCYELKDAGHDPNAALLQAADNYWLTVYVPTVFEVPKVASTAPNQVLAAMAEQKQALQDPEAKARADAARREMMARLPLRRVG